MEKGFLVVSVYDKITNQPINNATVIVRGDNYEENFSTNNTGKTNTIELDAPLKIYSLYPQKEVRPYSIYQVEVSKTDFEKTIIKGVQVFPDETSLQSVYLNNNDARTKNLRDEVFDVPPHSLWEETKEGGSQNISGITTNFSNTNPISNTYTPDILNTNNINLNDNRVVPEFFIPEYVIVHDGAPTDTNRPRYYVPFVDYIKNVASGEIYSTWPVESLMANIYAIMSFTMNRIHTEWYRSRGFNFTVTSLPRFDQTYYYNRTIFKSISDVVDQVFNYHIQRDNNNFPFLAQYNDGIQPNIPGRLSQWGSKYLADDGYSALQILRHYYGSSTILVSSEKTQGLPTTFPGYNLTIGVCGDQVQRLQVMLNAISGNFPAIPTISPVNGQYNDDTKDSVEVFQQVFELPVTGTVDFRTWYRIKNIYIAVSRKLE